MTYLPIPPEYKAYTVPHFTVPCSLQTGFDVLKSTATLASAAPVARLVSGSAAIPFQREMVSFSMPAMFNNTLERRSAEGVLTQNSQEIRQQMELYKHAAG